MKTLQDQVDFILTTFPKSRNSDITLMLELWSCFYPDRIINLGSGETGIKLVAIYELPREDNIKRIRARIQNVERRLLPTDLSIFVERAKASKDWKRFLGYAVDWDNTKWEKSIKDWYNRPKQTSLI